MTMSPMTFLTSSGPIAHAEANLGAWLNIVSIIVVVVIGLLVLSAAFRARRGENHNDVERSGENHLSWVIIGGMIIPGIILVLTMIFSLGTLYAVSAPKTAPAATIQIIGHRWWWEVKYVSRDPAQTIVTANEIHVPVGKPVKIELTSDDVIHSFWIPQLAGKTDVIPGQTNVAWLEADKPGVYRGQCTEYCGMQHAHMAAFVIAESPEKFAAWMKTQRDSAMTPTDPDAAAGLAVFQKEACAACHAIRGADALGRVGPDLTHLQSRLTLAAGVLDNTRGNLAGWISNSQALKPGNDMPTMTLSAGDLQALVAYLETLK